MSRKCRLEAALLEDEEHREVQYLPVDGHGTPAVAEFIAKDVLLKLLRQ